MSDLSSCTYKNTKAFCVEGEFKVKCIKVYDGDTITVALEPWKGFGYRRFSCRVAHYDCSEIKGSTEEEKKLAIEARDYLRALILDKEIVVRTICSKKKDPYGRLLVEVFIDGLYINQIMLNKFGCPYQGVGPKFTLEAYRKHRKNPTTIRV